MRSAKIARCIPVAFDQLDGVNLRREQWSDRLWRLAKGLRNATDGIRLSDHG